MKKIRMTFEEYLATLSKKKAKKERKFWEDHNADLAYIINKNETIIITDHEKIWNS